MQRDRRLLTVSPYVTSRAETGGTRRIHYLNRNIAAFGWDVTQVSLGSIRPLWLGTREAFGQGDGYRELRYSNPALPIVNRVLKQFGGAQVAPSYVPQAILRSSTFDRCLRERPVVMLEHPHAYGFVRGRIPQGSRLVLDAHNIESDLHTEAGNAIARGANRTLLDMEGELLERADLVFFCSDEDRRRAIDKFGLTGERFRVAPNGTDIGGIAVPDEAERRAAKRELGLGERPAALFVGTYWQPNVEAAQQIISLAREMPDTTFLIVGRVGQALGRGIPRNVRVTGFVPDVGRYAAAADLAINPMFGGSGSNVKVFDYLAYGLPVVSTPFGARGLDVEGEDAFVVADFEAFPAAISGLIGDELSAQRRAAARKLGERYDWRTIAGGMAAELDRIL